MRSRISRRRFLHLSVITTAGGVIAACAPQAPALPTAPESTDAPSEDAPAIEATAAPPSEEAPAAATGRYSEAPMLAERVAAGELPPVEDRLPLEPKLVNEHSIHHLYKSGKSSLHSGRKIIS